MTNAIETDLIQTSSIATGGRNRDVSVVVAVNADGSPIGGGSGGAGPSETNVSQFGGRNVSLGSNTSNNAMPVVVANDQTLSVVAAGSDTFAVSPVHDTVGQAWGPAAGFLDSISIAASDPVLDGGLAQLVLSAVTGGSTSFTLALGTSLATGGNVVGLQVSLTGLKIPIPSGGFHIALAGALTSGFYIVSGAFTTVADGGGNP